MTNETVLVVDTETTGTNLERCGVVQISAVLLQVREGKAPMIRTVLNTRCMPSVPISEEAAKIHGISMRDVALAPPEKFAAYQLKLILGTLPEGVIIAGHNHERFDVPILNRLCPALDLWSYPHIDTFILGRRWWPTADKHKLEVLYPMLLGKEPTNAHDAAADCHMVAEILCTQSQATGMTLTEMAAWCAQPQRYEVMPFGKHKGLPIEQVPMGYINFIRENFDDIDKDCLASVEYRLAMEGRKVEVD